MGTDILCGDRQNTMDLESIKKIQESGAWVGGLVKRDFRTHSGSSEHSLDSESKFEPSVAIRTPKAIV